VVTAPPLPKAPYVLGVDTDISSGNDGMLTPTGYPYTQQPTWPTAHTAHTLIPPRYRRVWVVTAPPLPKAPYVFDVETDISSVTDGMLTPTGYPYTQQPTWPTAHTARILTPPPGIAGCGWPLHGCLHGSYALVV